MCAPFLLAGALALDDYGFAWDLHSQQRIGEATLNYLAGEGERAFDGLRIPKDRYFGAAIEAPLVLAGLGDDQSARYFVTHLFFLLGGIFCYLLVWRLFKSRPLAAAALVLFLLHPRIYAHSFFNSKDVPCLVTFMVSLYLLHRALRRDSLAAFLLCGVGVGLLVNLRIMGLLLFAAVLALRGLDLATASGAHERKRVLLTTGAFALAAALTYYASLPVLWTDPIGRFAELVRVLDVNPIIQFNLFRGEILYAGDGPPFDYVPVWVGLTTPPATLLLALGGTVALVWRGVRRPRDVLRNTPLRFGFLLIALPVIATATVVVLENNIYFNWRHLYFLYAPLLLLAVFGLRGLASSLRGRWMRAGAYALTGTAIAVTVVSMVRVHPHLDNHFTLLTDRTTPGDLAATHTITYWPKTWAPHAVAAIARDYPSGDLYVSSYWKVDKRVSQPDRERLMLTSSFRSGERNFHEIHFDLPCPETHPAVTRISRVYAHALYCIVDPVAYFGGLRREALATEALDRSRFDAYRVGNQMVYVRDGCTQDDLRTRVFLRIFPVDPADLAPFHRFGFREIAFVFADYGARIDGNCVAVAPLPDIPIAAIRTGQYTPEYAGSLRRAAANAEPVVHAPFRVYLDGHILTYVRDACTAEDAAAPFFVHAYPVDTRSLYPWRTRHGYEGISMNDVMRTEDGGCVAVALLPRYPIASIHTGQHNGGGGLWAARFGVTPPDTAPAAPASAPVASAVYDVYRDGDALVYVRDGCTDEDAGAVFILHLSPVDPDDLPAERKRHGFDNLDFFLWEHGDRTDGRCIAAVPLPAWPIASVLTGQYDETGARWTEEFDWPDGE